MSVPLTAFNADHFLPLVGETFRWRTSGGDSEVSMQLLQVERFQQQPGLVREPFSLLFVMHDQAPLGWGLHTLVHDAFEPCDLLLSRVSVPKHERNDPKGMFYEAVFG